MDPAKGLLPEAGPSVIRYAEAEIPTSHGPLRVVVYREARSPEVREHAVLVCGRPDPDDVLARIHSECLTSEVFGSLKCDCREQFDAGLSRIVENGSGMMLYLRQEGRGIGLGNKIRAYALQEQGLDTVDANHQLGFATDLRTYDIAADMLHDLGVRGVSLMTNNPDKIEGLEQSGIIVNQRLSIEVEANPHSASYLGAKRVRLGHMLELVRSR
ncbi:MAG: GTP cyclohydrolase II [Deltaproteobacteria bacterium]|nr:GTP cyclohydrolase II [Deltaproteobacteria bacterium]